MSTRHEQALERFDRLTKQAVDGIAFYPYGERGAGYRLGERAARRIKLYFEYQSWIVMGLFAVQLAVLSKLLDTHPFFAAVLAGAIYWVVDRLLMHGLLAGSPKVSTRLTSEDFAGNASRPATRLETSCTLINTGMILLLLVVFALVTRSIDAWLYATACAAFLAYAFVEARKRQHGTPARVGE